MYCFVVLCFAFTISPCCVLFSLSLRFFFAYVFIFGTYVLFSCIILLLEFNVNKIHETKYNSVYKNKLKKIAIQQN